MPRHPVRASRETDPSARGDILLYQTEDGRQRIEVRLDQETVWLSQRLMAELFQVKAGTINYHVKGVYRDRELLPEATCRNYRIVQEEGGRPVTRQIDFYNLEMILAVGYRVRSHRGIQFRQWATERLREFIVKGFVLDDERLAEPGGVDYFDELLDRIRAIRASEKRFYQKVRDIYALSADYDPSLSMSQEFFATVQNKLLYAVSGRTAAEIIQDRADATRPNMGLTTWKGAGRGRRLGKADAAVAKNYLDQEELRTLELLVNQYLDFAELQARQRKVMYMADWKEKLNAFLRLNDQGILAGAGSVSAEMARGLAHAEYERFVRARITVEADQADEELRNAVRRLAKGDRKE